MILSIFLANLMLAKDVKPGQANPEVALKHLSQAATTYDIRVGVTDAGFNNITYLNTVPSEFNSVTVEAEMKFDSIHPCPPKWLVDSNPSVADWVRKHGADREGTEYDCSIENSGLDEWHWTYVDKVVTWARDHNLGYYAHTLLWHFQNPAWLDLNQVNLSLGERERIMEEHIRGVVKRYCTFSNVYAFDVVNEAIRPDGGLWPYGPWQDIPNYIDKAFRISRDALDRCGRSDVKLFYNDFEIEYGLTRDYNQPEFPPGKYNKTEAVYNYLGRLLRQPNPTPIDGIGFQTHLRITPTSLPHDTSKMVAAMNKFTDGLGLEVKITELDVVITGANPSDLYDAQASQFSGVATACLLARRCTGLTVWGTDDGTSWRNLVGENADPVMFADQGKLVYDPGTKTCVNRSSISNPLGGSGTQNAAEASIEFCPKPAYLAVYDTLFRGLTRVYFPAVVYGRP